MLIFHFNFTKKIPNTWNVQHLLTVIFFIIANDALGYRARYSQISNLTTVDETNKNILSIKGINNNKKALFK